MSESSGKQMRILVTGCAGYIGSYLCRVLCNNCHDVVGIDNLWYNNYQAIEELLINPYYKKRFTFIQKDVTDEPCDLDCDAVIHLAALVGAPVCDLHHDFAYNTNVKGVVNHLFPGKKHIYPNTNSLYGATTGLKLCTEFSPVNPISHYAKTKLEAEQEVLAAGGVSLRLATVFGVSHRMRLDLLVNDFTYKAYFQNKIELFDDNAIRNYVHISDVVKCIMFALDNYSQMESECFNLGNDSCNATKGELVEQIKHRLPNLQVEKTEGSDPDKRNYQVSSRKLHKVGFRATTTLGDGITELMEYFKQWPKHYYIENAEGMYNCS